MHLRFYHFKQSPHDITVDIRHGYTFGGILGQVRAKIEARLKEDWEQLVSGEYNICVVVIQKDNTRHILTLNGKEPSEDATNGALYKIRYTATVHVAKFKKGDDPKSYMDEMEFNKGGDNQNENEGSGSSDSSDNDSILESNSEEQEDA